MLFLTTVIALYIGTLKCKVVFKLFRCTPCFFSFCHFYKAELLKFATSCFLGNGACPKGVNYYRKEFFLFPLRVDHIEKGGKQTKAELLPLKVYAFTLKIRTL